MEGIKSSTRPNLVFFICFYYEITVHTIYYNCSFIQFTLFYVHHMTKCKKHNILYGDGIRNNGKLELYGERRQFDTITGFRRRQIDYTMFQNTREHVAVHRTLRTTQQHFNTLTHNTLYGGNENVENSSLITREQTQKF